MGDLEEPELRIKALVRVLYINGDLRSLVNVSSYVHGCINNLNREQSAKLAALAKPVESPTPKVPNE